MDQAARISLGRLVVKTGAGGSNSVTNLTPAGELTVGSTVQITNSAGNDSISLHGGTTRIGGGVTINNGNGDNGVTLAGQTSLFVGKVTITNGKGININNIGTAGDTIVAGNVTIRNGDGTSNSSVQGDGGVTVGGNLSVTNGKGSDVLTVNSSAGTSTIGGSVRIVNRDGGSITGISSATGVFVGGALTSTSTAGFDQAIIGSVGTPTTINGNVSVGVGADGSITILQGSRLHVNGGVRITARDGGDTASLATGQDGSIAGGARIDLGDGTNQSVSVFSNTAGNFLTIGKTLRISTTESALGAIATLDLFQVKVQGAASIITGAGDDEIDVDASVFAAFSLNSNDGEDSIRIARALTTIPTRFHGVVRVNTGAGDDSVDVGNFAAGNMAVFATTNTWEGGTQALADDTIAINSFGNIFFGPAPAINGFEVVS
jgi:hypothetical protein